MMVVSHDAMTENEVAHTKGKKLKDEAMAVYGIRDDGVPRGPDNYYLASDIIQ